MNDLKSIRIKNYKCFKDVSFSIKNINILIGENNAGKSTAIEAIKLIAFAIEKLKKSNYIECPEEISDMSRNRCVLLNIQTLLIDIDLVSYKYQGGVSHIFGYFSGNLRVEVFILNKEVYAMAFANDICITKRSEMINYKIPSIYVMPHFNLLRGSERLIDEKRTLNDRFNYRSSLHFRNELYAYENDIPLLNRLLEMTWKGLQVNMSYKIGVSSVIDVQIRDVDFSAEIMNYGSGLQMWIQILWFLCKIHETDCVVVLDEPDVYIHADLQRKLYHLVADKYPQIIIATHSIEIISETQIENIMIIDKRQKRFSFCKKKSNLEMGLQSIGTTQNLMLTKLRHSNKCLFVEGEDISVLDELFKVAINDKTKSIKDFATCKLDGKDNYKESFGAAKMFYEDSDGTFRTFCLLDRDYNDDYNSRIRDRAEANKVIVFILNRLEIENYLIVPRIYAKLLNIDIEEVEAQIDQLADQLKDITFDRILEAKEHEYKKLGSKINLANVSKETREFINSQWNCLENKISTVAGKELKAKIYEWMKSVYGFSCSDKKIIQQFQVTDIPQDLLEFLKELGK